LQSKDIKATGTMKGYFCYLALAALCCIGCTSLATASEATESKSRLLTASDSQSLKKVTTPGLRANRSNQHVNEIADKDRQLTKGERRTKELGRAQYRYPKASTEHHQMNKIKRSSHGKSKASKQSKGSKGKGKGKGSKSSKGKGKGKGYGYEDVVNQAPNTNTTDTTNTNTGVGDEEPSLARNGTSTDAPTQGPGSTNREPAPAPTPARTPTVDQGGGALSEPSGNYITDFLNGPVSEPSEASDPDEEDYFGSIKDGVLLRFDGMSMPTSPPTKVPVSTILLDYVWRCF
jgi:hypothetical protein